MARPRRIVAEGLGRPAPDEDRARRPDRGHQLFGVLDMQGQVLGAIEVRHCDGLGQIGDQHRPRLGQRRARDGFAGQGGDLLLDRFEHRVDRRGPVGDQNDLGVGVVFGLAQQVGRDQLRIGEPVGDDQQFRRPRRHVRRRPAGQRRGIAFRLGHIGVARPEQLVAGGNLAVVERHAEGHGGDRLGSTQQPQGVEPGLGGGEDHRRMRRTVLRRRGHRDAGRHARDARRNGQHQQGREQRRRPAGRIETGRTDGAPDDPRGHARRRLDPFRILGSRGLMEDTHILRRDPQRPRIRRGQGVARLGDHGVGDGDAPRRRAVQLDRPLGHGRAAARLHVVKDRAHDVADTRLRAPFRPGESVFPPRRIQR